MVSQPSPHFHVRSFGRFDETTDLVEQGIRHLRAGTPRHAPRHIRDSKNPYEPLLVSAFPACTLS
jgi:hypothetical protein